ncbi:MAG: hypothetical protein VKN33_02685 [Candidatus Sericytochromatia bacterium]|nr:hypothetical protein [Candidatus Sericytochromatia bacterium]
MTATYSGRIALQCPDCETHLVNATPYGERYLCHDCGLEMTRDKECFRKVRYGEVVGEVSVYDVALQMTWRSLGYAHAV